MSDRVTVHITWPGGQFSLEVPAEAVIEVSRRSSGDLAATTPPRNDPVPFLGSLTPAETGVLTELAHRPDTRSRLAATLGISTSTLDNHLASIKRKLLEHLESAGQRPHDGYLSTEAVIGWASRFMRE